MAYAGDLKTIQPTFRRIGTTRKESTRGRRTAKLASVYAANVSLTSKAIRAFTAQVSAPLGKRK